MVHANAAPPRAAAALLLMGDGDFGSQMSVG